MVYAFSVGLNMAKTFGTMGPLFLTLYPYVPSPMNEHTTSYAFRCPSSATKILLQLLIFRDCEQLSFLSNLQATRTVVQFGNTVLILVVVLGNIMFTVNSHSGDFLQENVWVHLNL